MSEENKINVMSGELDKIGMSADETAGYVPYTGATTNIDIGANSFEMDVNEVITIGANTITNDGTDFIMNDSLDVGGAGQSIIGSGLVVNDNGGGGAVDDFRVESDSQTSALLLDASANTFGIAVATTITALLTTTAGKICNTTRTTSTPYAVLATDEVILVDTDGGAITVNLPAGVDGTHYKIVNCGSSGNAVTLDPNGTEELFNGGAGVATTLYDGEIADINYETTEGWF